MKLKSLFAVATAPLVLLFSPLAWGQAAPVATSAGVQSRPADPALWVVKDADTTIYLFGTVHVLKPGLDWFDSAVQAAFDKSDTLVLELIEPDPATMQGLLVKMARAPAGSKPIAEQLPADKRGAYLKAMADIGIPPAAFDVFQPWLAGITISIAGLPKLGYNPASGAEKVLTVAAKQAGKPIIGLETAEQQLGYFSGMSPALQLAFLGSAVEDYPKLGSELDRMIDQWAAGDPEGLGATMNEGMRDTPELAKILLTDRNARWAKWIEARLKTPGTVFLAVGAGHLAGTDSVQAFLAKDRVAAERVPY
ncbi:TraB/GumN family protein [Sphingomonas pokkalii]|uniref:TraB/GumN family protein n=1 Tax=Sphingomonas pokkalii TaxID=2175090 RepID=A0A2U0SC74_9SPHN|nr:TraB/GumN family protein [Sphingomonas pokkalii]PVX28914.1 TraB/GumN family protein [Sphingomonas pokkalii]